MIHPSKIRIYTSFYILNYYNSAGFPPYVPASRPNSVPFLELSFESIVLFGYLQFIHLYHKLLLHKFTESFCRFSKPASGGVIEQQDFNIRISLPHGGCPGVRIWSLHSRTTSAFPSVSMRPCRTQRKKPRKLWIIFRGFFDIHQDLTIDWYGLSGRSGINVQLLPFIPVSSDCN